jgi:hypothetical protein
VIWSLFSFGNSAALTGEFAYNAIELETRTVEDGEKV